MLSRLSWTIVCLGVVGFTPWVSAQYPGAAEFNGQFKPGFDSIDSEQTKVWLEVLTSDAFGGRGTGQVGYTRAAHWVAGKLAEFGLDPIGDGGTYFQNLPRSRRFIVIDGCSIEGPNDLKLAGADQLGFVQYTANPRVSGKVVFVNISGANTRFQSDVNLRDKIVVYVANQDVAARTLFDILRQRPAAVIRLAEAPKSVPQMSDSRRSRVEVQVSLDAGKKIAEALGVDAQWLAVNDKAGLEVQETESELTINVRTREEPVALPNVVAWLEGSDPELKHEYVTIGAHLDHLGMRGNSIYRGADDNGSGSTAILQIAKAMSENPVKPKRSILFIWFAAEEVGLVGSRHYVDHPIKPLDNMVCMLNIDMIGRNEEKQGDDPEDNEDTIHLVGSQKGNSGLHEIVLEANKSVNLKFEYDEEDSVFGRSDQASFYRKGIPVAFLFGGFSPYYHKPTDTMEGINFHKIASAAKLFYLTAISATENGKLQLKE